MLGKFLRVFDMFSRLFSTFSDVCTMCVCKHIFCMWLICTYMLNVVLGV